MIVLGSIFEHTFSIDDHVYQGFRSTFRDENPLHTVTDFAIGKGFKGCVMHGNILNGFLSYLVGELLPIKNVIIHSQTISFLKPVYLNDKVTVHCKVAGIFESVSTAELKYKFTNQDSIVVAKGMVQIGII